MTWTQPHPDLIVSPIGTIAIDAYDRNWLGQPVVYAKSIGGQKREFNSIWFAKRWLERCAR